MTRLAQCLIAAVVALLGWLLPTLFFDDAYITFRYAAHLASGEGFAYNPPERLLGVTTPLFTFLLAGAARLGIEPESAALLLGIASHALLALAVFASVRQMLGSGTKTTPRVVLAAATAGGLITALQPHLALTAMGGMETGLFCALILLTLTASDAGAGRRAGFWLGLALLTRPDAVLLVPLTAWLLWRRGDGASRRQEIRRAAAVASALFLPWVLLAISWFGSPIPHSIAAKRLIHPYSPIEVLAEFGRFLMDDTPLMILLAIALAGHWYLKTSRLAIALLLFMALYLGSYAFSGITPFPWYVNPLIPPVIVLAAAAVAALAAVAKTRTAIIQWLATLGAAILLLTMGLHIHREAPGLRQSWEEWEGTYEIAARWILNDSRPGDRVYVGEVGVIGFLLPGRVILDSSGINSKEVVALRRGTVEEDPQWSRDVVLRLVPDYIATATAYLHIGTLANEGWFARDYERIPLPLIEHAGQVIFRKRDRSR